MRDHREGMNPEPKNITEQVRLLSTDGGPKLVLSAQAKERRKARRKQQAASKRANRG